MARLLSIILLLSILLTTQQKPLQHPQLQFSTITENSGQNHPTNLIKTLTEFADDASLQDWFKGLLFIFIGFLLCILGLKHIKYFIYIISFFVGFACIQFIPFTLENNHIKVEQLDKNLYIIAGVILGAIFAWLLTFAKKHQKLILGISIGLMFGFFIMWVSASIIIVEIFDWAGLAILAASAFLGILFSNYYTDYFVLFGTAVIGSMAIITGVALCGGYIKTYQRGIESLNVSEFCVMILVMGSCFLFGSFYQWRSYKKSEGQQNLSQYIIANENS